MSKDNYLECDSPNSKHELNETSDEINLNETVNEHCMYEFKNDEVVRNDDNVSFKPQNGEGGIVVHTTLHETFPPSSSSSRHPLFDYSVRETSEPRTSRAADLVRQPSRWGLSFPEQ